MTMIFKVFAGIVAVIGVGLGFNIGDQIGFIVALISVVMAAFLFISARELEILEEISAGINKNTPPK